MGKLTSLEGSTLRLFSLCNDQGLFCIILRKSSVSAYLEVLQLLRTQKVILSLIKSCCPHLLPKKLTGFRGKHIGHIQLVMSSWLRFKWPHVRPSKIQLESVQSM